MNPSITIKTALDPLAGDSQKINVISVPPGAAAAVVAAFCPRSLAAPPGPIRAATITEIVRVSTESHGQPVVAAAPPLTPGVTRDALVGSITGTLAGLCTQSDAAYWLSNRDTPLASRDLWHILDNLHRPRLGIWIDLETLIARGETPSVFLKQLAQYARAIAWRFETLLPLETRDELPQVSRVIEIAKGLGFRGLLVIDDVPSDTAAQDLANTIADKIRAAWNKPVVVLTAYKGDKTAPKFAAR